MQDCRQIDLDQIEKHILASGLIHGAMTYMYFKSSCLALPDSQ